MDRETVRSWLPAYALNALDADERREVEALLAEDETARQELREYSQIAESVLLTAPATAPPADLEQKLMQRAAETRTRRFPVRLAAIAAAVLLLFIAASVFVAVRPPPPNSEQVYERLLADAEAVTVAVVPALSPDIEGQLVYRPEDTTAVIRVSNLPPIEAGQAFQLWLVDDRGSVSGGVYQLAQPTNFIMVSAERPIADYLRFGVSLEPASGSPLGNRASGPRVFSIPIQAG